MNNKCACCCGPFVPDVEQNGKCRDVSSFIKPIDDFFEDLPEDTGNDTADQCPRDSGTGWFGGGVETVTAELVIF